MAKVNRKKRETKSRNETIFLFIFPFVLTILSLLFISAVSVSSDLQKSDNFIVLLCTIAFCSFISGFLSGRIKRKQGLITGIIYVLPTTVLLIITSITLNSFSFDLNILFSLLLSIISSAIGGIVGVNIRQNVKRVKK